MIRVKVQVDKASAALVASGIGRQARFAAAVALTRAAQSIAKAAPDEAERQLGGLTTRYTRSGLYIDRATRDALVATVGYKRKQAGYMVYQVEGGRRAPKRLAQRLPAEIKLDPFGNVPAGTIKRLVAQARGGRRVDKRRRERLGLPDSPSLFYGVPRGRRAMPAGLWLRDRQRHQLRPLIVFPQRSVSYRPRFEFYDWGRRRAIAEMPGLLADALRQAAASAR